MPLVEVPDQFLYQDVAVQNNTQRRSRGRIVKQYRIWYSDVAERSVHLRRVIALLCKQPERSEVFLNDAAEALSLTHDLQAHGITSAFASDDMTIQEAGAVFRNFYWLNADQEPSDCLVSSCQLAPGTRPGQINRIIHYDLPESRESLVNRNGYHAVAVYFVPDTELGRAKMTSIEQFYDKAFEDWPWPTG